MPNCRRAIFCAPSKTVGKSPHQYILSLRLEEAEQLVIKTDLPLATIASRTGFANHSHLTATMRRYKFTTPSALRRDRILQRARTQR
ncbi:helix-turn-helix domain-containing protein [Roseibium salinum]|uniref:helix-turn-helix domain-containing protein n=1 Tax=Roseibium salinum TaxID=1604349 RepID=UPI0036110E36